MIKEQANALVPTDFGNFRIAAYSDKEEDRMPELVVFSENWKKEKITNVRIHSECITGDVFHSNRCDCGDQLMASLQYINKHEGLIIYHRQEGRNIGIIDKLKAYNLQDEGMNTVEANLALGHQADERNYENPVQILQLLHVSKINLMTNNPNKIKVLEEYGIEVVNRIPIQMEINETNASYLQTKRDVMGHFLKL